VSFKIKFLCSNTRCDCAEYSILQLSKLWMNCLVKIYKKRQRHQARTARSCVLSRSTRAQKTEGARPCLVARSDRAKSLACNWRRPVLDRFGPSTARSSPVQSRTGSVLGAPTSVFGACRTGVRSWTDAHPYKSLV